MPIIVALRGILEKNLKKMTRKRDCGQEVRYFLLTVFAKENNSSINTEYVFKTFIYIHATLLKT